MLPLAAALALPSHASPPLLPCHAVLQICGDHFKAPCVAIDGQNLRFCQKCGRFQVRAAAAHRTNVQDTAALIQPSSRAQGPT